jgi:hypothetical protein
VPDLARADQVVQRIQDLFHRRHGIPEVQPIKIDVVGLQAAQGGFDRSIDVLSPVAARIGIAARGVEGELRRQDHLIAHGALADEFAEHLFAFALCVGVGGVDEIAARVEVTVENSAGVGLFVAPAPFGSKGHGAEAQRADAQAGAAERDVGVGFNVHVSPHYAARASFALGRTFSRCRASTR